ncbi:hypothetical protein QF001_004375 [Paraburkholderia youngii]
MRLWIRKNDCRRFVRGCRTTGSGRVLPDDDHGQWSATAPAVNAPDRPSADLEPGDASTAALRGFNGHPHFESPGKSLPTTVIRSFGKPAESRRTQILGPTEALARRCDQHGLPEGWPSYAVRVDRSDAANLAPVQFVHSDPKQVVFDVQQRWPERRHQDDARKERLQGDPSRVRTRSASLLCMPPGAPRISWSRCNKNRRERANMDWKRWYSLRSYLRSSRWTVPLIAIAIYAVAKPVAEMVGRWMSSQEGCVAVRRERRENAISKEHLMKRASRTAVQRAAGLYPGISSALS